MKINVLIFIMTVQGTQGVTILSEGVIQMTIERAIEILDPTHREHYDSIDVVNEACKMGMEALALKKTMTQRIAELETQNTDLFYKLNGVMLSVDKWLEGEELKQDEVNRAITMREKTLQIVEKLEAEVERLQKHTEEVTANCIQFNKANDKANNQRFLEAIAFVQSEAYREFGEKITETFLQYAHLHSHADCARKDYIKAADGTEIEMQSVWDAFTLEKYGMAVYEVMNRLQTNIELIEKDRLLTELEKDFRLLVKELTESNE